MRITDGSDDNVGLGLLQQRFDNSVADASVGALGRRERERRSTARRLKEAGKVVAHGDEEDG